MAADARVCLGWRTTALAVGLATIGATASAQSRAARTCGVQGAGTLTGNGVGALRIGAPAAAVRRSCEVVRDTTEYDSEANLQRVLHVRVGGDMAVAEIVDGKVWRLSVATRGLRTADSLGVGTPLGVLVTRAGVRADMGEGLLYASVPEHCGMSFELTPAPRRFPRAWTAAELKRLPRRTAVSRVLVFGCTPSPR